MDAVREYFWSLGSWNWFILGAVLLVAETLVPGVYLVWFGMAACTVGAMAILADMGGLSAWFGWLVQLFVFAVLVIGSVFLARSWAGRQHAPADAGSLNARAAQYFGRVFTVEDAIREGRGRVRIGDTLWSAEGPDVAAGGQVRVTGARGTVLLVEPASAGEPRG